MDDSLNLARAWRSKNFDEMVGQELAIRLVKNSLYKQQFFPVYLLAGQRGCGKTTLGRIFAAAINCAEQEAFSKQPREVKIPCQQCASCIAMRDGAHPDFYEVDAASHTGVDNVRGLIEAASFLPLLGRKKIYLIDEAHMLSKAAFNAFLKILEEPPSSVVFMLATTDPHKILDTVRSRCFQLFLDPVEPQVLQAHLAQVCQKENLPYEESALLSIAYESEGSVRDALNHLERLRLGYGAVTYEAAIKVLGDISYDLLFDVCESALTATPDTLTQMLQKIVVRPGAHARLWKKMAEILRGFIDVYAGITPAPLKIYETRLRAIAQQFSLEQLITILELWYQAEPLFVKTQAPHMLMELLLLQINQKMVTHKRSTSVKDEKRDLQQEEGKKEEIKKNDEPIGQWADFVNRIRAHDDPLVLSIFKQGRFIEYAEPQVKVQFGQQLVFFKELLEQTKPVWHSLLRIVFGEPAVLQAEFTDKNSDPSATTALGEDVRLSNHRLPATVPSGVKRTIAPATPVDYKDPDRWKKVHALLQVFPGAVGEEREI